MNEYISPDDTPTLDFSIGPGQFDEGQVGAEHGFQPTTSDMFRIGIIGTEVLPPSSGFLRYGALALTEIYTRSPVAGAAALGFSTLALEWASYRAAVGWIADNKVGTAVDWMRDKVSNYHDRLLAYKDRINEHKPRLKPGRLIPNIPLIPENPEPGTTQIPLLGQAVLGLEGGTVVLLTAKQEVDRSRDLKINKRDGRIAVALIAGALAVQGAAISEGVGLVIDNTEKGVGGLTVAAIAYSAWRHIKHRRAARAEVKNISPEVSTNAPEGGTQHQEGNEI